MATALFKPNLVNGVRLRGVAVGSLFVRQVHVVA